MTWTGTRLNSAFLVAILFLCVIQVGCSAPPSVAPLLRVTDRALHDEAGRRVQDTERDRAYLRQSLDALEDAYERDLAEAPELTPQWVSEATAVYVAAREAVLENEHAMIRERETRAENLTTARAALDRAINLIEEQDRLITDVVGEDLRRVLLLESTPQPEVLP